MSLTPENMQTDPDNWNRDYVIVWEDISKMDGKQLDDYVRMAFVGNSDYQTWPEQFWSGFSIDGSSTYQMSPGNWFSEIYVNIPHAQAGKFFRRDRKPLNFDPDYRTRFETIIENILEESQEVEGIPDEMQMRLAQYAIHAVGDIKFREGDNSISEQIRHGIGEGIKMTELPQVLAEVQMPDVNGKKIYQLASTLKEDARYAQLDFEFI